MAAKLFICMYDPQVLLLARPTSPISMLDVVTYAACSRCDGALRQPLPSHFQFDAFHNISRFILTLDPRLNVKMSLYQDMNAGWALSLTAPGFYD